MFCKIAIISILIYLNSFIDLVFFQGVQIFFVIIKRFDPGNESSCVFIHTGIDVRHYLRQSGTFFRCKTQTDRKHIRSIRGSPYIAHNSTGRRHTLKFPFPVNICRRQTGSQRIVFQCLIKSQSIRIMQDQIGENRILIFIKSIGFTFCSVACKTGTFIRK